MPRRKVLFVCHNHPKVRPGGAEAYAYELHRALRESSTWEPVFVARSGPPLSRTGRPHPGTYFSPVDGACDEYFAYGDGYDFDWLYQTMRHSKELYTKHFREFLLALEPDVVHFQHTLFLGFDLVREVRNTLPDVPIVYTLHEFLPICHNNGQMIRTADGEPCTHSSPRRCHECFPAISPQTFFLRNRFIQAQLGAVDLFIAPSAFLRERFIEWGLPADKVMLEEYGRATTSEPAPPPSRRRRDRLAFFGQLSPYKGVDVLLEAMRELARARRRPSAPCPRLRVHGANLDFQEHAFQDRFHRLLDETSDCVRLVGEYTHAQLPGLMEAADWVIVPSIWWENSPLVIQEAFMHGKPVICSDIGGMAEKVADGVNGLHFRVGDPVSLARVIERAVESPALWDALRAGIPAVHGMADHVPVIEDAYERLLAQRAAAWEVEAL
jgi:glycosyltransferase involved in cell wall biosynthesis